mmetsp:Transcript_40046/g.75129  ORF Transcript_40046/g.75129 Transcript_40046/m.75129 type:complete len:241 (+) Transcript_40046:723-1445(+)
MSVHEPAQPSPTNLFAERALRTSLSLKGESTASLPATLSHSAPVKLSAGAWFSSRSRSSSARLSGSLGFCSSRGAPCASMSWYRSVRRRAIASEAAALRSGPSSPAGSPACASASVLESSASRPARAERLWVSGADSVARWRSRVAAISCNTVCSSRAGSVRVVMRPPRTLLPMRPARPALCTYSSMLAGGATLYTWVTPCRSSPRAELAVAQSSEARPSLNASSALSGSYPPDTPTTTR